MRRLLIALPVFILLHEALAQIKAGQDPTFSVSVNLVKIPISVFDDHGNMITDLRRQDFRLWEDSTPQQIRSFGLDTNPVSVVLVLDTSATVKKELKQIKEAAEDFAAALTHDDRISVITFDDEVTLILNWTDNQKLVRKALRKVDSGIRTALYDAMFSAAHDQLQNIEGRKAIILLTDCLNNQSSIGFSDAAREIVNSQATLYVVSKTAMVRQEASRERRVIMLSDIYKRLFGDGNYIEEFFQKREAEMTDLAEKTGGRCFFPTDYDQIKDVYGEVARELKSKYYVTYVSNQAMQPDSYHRIALEYLPPSSKITYRKGYFYEPRPVHFRR
ncbi:MAG TPA: VWA domain-containing protein [Acidobacteriota bacterium]|nr:VWA domain-containing protein [Acidobacteriota bacterium]